MKIFKLSITDRGSSHLEAATTTEDVIVRAGSVDEARDLAVAAFSIATRRKRTGEDVRICPWRLSEVSSCDEITDTQFDPEGLPQILNINA